MSGIADEGGEIVVIFNRLARRCPDSNLERAIPLSKTVRGKAAACHAVASFNRRRVKTRITLIFTNSL
jgi:hypothetical protein